MHTKMQSQALISWPTQLSRAPRCLAAHTPKRSLIAAPRRRVVPQASGACEVAALSALPAIPAAICIPTNWIGAFV